MDKILAAIEKQSSRTPLGVPDLIFEDFRGGGSRVEIDPDKFSLNPLQLSPKNGGRKIWSLRGKRVLLAPACPLTQNILSDAEIQQADWIGLADRNPNQQGKVVNGHTICSYDDIPALGVDVILLASPEKHRADILHTIARNATSDTTIAEFEGEDEKKMSEHGTLPSSHARKMRNAEN